MSNTQLPADIKNEIFTILLNHSHASRTIATEELAELFATTLHQAEQEINTSDEYIKRVTEEYDKLNESYISALALLEKFITRHEAGLLPDRFIYEEIKTFLDGTK